MAEHLSLLYFGCQEGMGWNQQPREIEGSSWEEVFTGAVTHTPPNSETSGFPGEGQMPWLKAGPQGMIG